MRLRSLLQILGVGAAVALLAGCGAAPEPPEVKLAEVQDLRLQRAGAALFSPDGYARFVSILDEARRVHELEARSHFWSRPPEPSIDIYRRCIEQGELVCREVLDSKAALSSSLLQRHQLQRDRLVRLRRLTGVMNEGRLARRNLTRAEVSLQEVPGAVRTERFDLAEKALASAEEQIRRAERALQPLVGRYTDPYQLARWRTVYDRAVAESRHRNGILIVVFKFDRELVVYRGGRPVRTYRIGLGRNGLSDKIQNGDHATPEGRYEVVRKNSRSAYNRALVINYPNDEDRRNFQRLKRQGAIPSWATMGGMVEIHGGGKDGQTQGCVSLDDPQMEELFGMTEVGTPVVIVGTVDRHLVLEAARSR